MTFEHKITFTLADLKAVVFECLTGGAKISLPPDKMLRPPDRCPSGHERDWNLDTRYASSSSPVIAFLSSLAKLRDPLTERGFRIYLEADEKRSE